MRRRFPLIPFFILFLHALPLHALDPSQPGFHAALLKICTSGLGQQGVKICDTALQFCMNKTYECYKKANCSLTNTNPPRLDCEGGVGGCTDVTPYVLEFRGKGHPCEDLEINVAEAGCGNAVTELLETCDIANLADKVGCPADCGVPLGTKCWNGELDAGEECDAGPENGKLSAGCDLECKIIVAPSAGAAGGVSDSKIVGGNSPNGSVPSEVIHPVVDEDLPREAANSAQGPGRPAASCSLKAEN